MFEVIENKKQKALIKVMGVGGCGGNAVDYMIEKMSRGLIFFVLIQTYKPYKRARQITLFKLEKS